MEIRIDDLTGSEIAWFLDEHIKEMKSVSPPESKHALDLEGLRQPEVTLYRSLRRRHATIGISIVLVSLGVFILVYMVNGR